MRNRVSFLIDGFNVYHSIKEGSKRDGQILLWLDLKGLCNSYLENFGKDATLADVYYFSAYATHLTAHNPDVITRHKTYVGALKQSGVRVEMGRFKEKQVWCANCRQIQVRHEEKETDVAIASKLFELLHTNACDTVVLVSGDTDLIPAIKTAQQLFPDKQIAIGFPHLRYNAQLDQAVSFSFKIRRHQYARHQFPDPVVLADGRKILKPRGW